MTGGENEWNRLKVNLFQALYWNLLRGNKKATKNNYNILEVETRTKDNSKESQNAGHLSFT